MAISGQKIVKFIPGKPFRSKIDPSFPRAIQPKKRSIFGFLSRFGRSEKQKERKEEKPKEKVNVPLEEVRHQEEKIEVETKEQKKKKVEEPERPPKKPEEPKEDLSKETLPKLAQKAEPKATPSPPASGAPRAEKEKEEKEEKEVKKKKKIKTVDIKDKKIPKKVLALLPEYMARLYKTVPIEEKDGKLILAMQNPNDLQTIEFIKKKTDREVEVVGATEEDINTVLDRYTGIEAEIEKALKGSQFVKELKKKEKKEKEGLISEEAPTAKIVKSIITQAVRMRASDIHIEPKEFDVGVRYRVDGVLQNVTTLPKSVKNAVVTKVKILSKLKIDETRLPQDGRFKTKIDEREIDFRVSTFPSAFGEKLVMRILDKSKGILTLEELGLKGGGFKIVEDNVHKSHGMTLVTGPTGSGKTTTLYAILDRLNTVGQNIVTLEDPIEYQIEGINQGQVNPKIGFTFASGLRSILRQDPDVVMVGEIRDFETAGMAIHAALTGHIVLSTLHTNDAAGAIPRLIDMEIEPFLITSAVNAIIAQRLTRRLCEKCMEEDNINETMIKEIRTTLEGLPEKEKKKINMGDLKFYKSKGCEACNNTGYKGRIGVFEVLPVTSKIQEVTLEKPSGDIIAGAAKEEGMITLKQDALLKALDKLTSIEEVWRVTKD